MNKSFHIFNLGCKVNKVDADDMAARLIAAGARQGALDDAKVVLINTCTVTNEADAKSRKAMRRALSMAGDAVVIVCGCGATVDPEQFEPRKDDNEGQCQIISDRHLALEKTAGLLGLDFEASCTSPKSKTFLKTGEGFNTRAQVKIQDGCDNRCSYCIVPLARGKARSMPSGEMLTEIEALIEAGTQEIVLTGIDLGSYHDNSKTLVKLLSDALAISSNRLDTSNLDTSNLDTSNLDTSSLDTNSLDVNSIDTSNLGSSCRFRLSSIELPDVTDELLGLISSSHGRVCMHLHIPLQSGSDAVLTAMNRRYDAAGYLSRLTAIKRQLPRIALTTDVIVGFPGETEEDFNATLSLCRKLGFSRIHVFRYSRRPGTLAASLPRQLAPQIKAERAQRLRELTDELMNEDALRRVGNRERVIIEKPFKGRSESYYPVRVKENHKRGSLVALDIVGYEHGELIAENSK